MYCKSYFLIAISPVIFSINSSKVYCKFTFYKIRRFKGFVLIVAKCIVNANTEYNEQTYRLVLIVAKCIVNYEKIIIDSTYELVLIVAKCIVNVKDFNSLTYSGESINSSKVYCK